MRTIIKVAATSGVARNVVAYRARERARAQLDLTTEGYPPTRWARGPRVIMCDLRVGALFETIDGTRLQLVRRVVRDELPSCRYEDGRETTMITAAAVLPITSWGAP